MLPEFDLNSSPLWVNATILVFSGIVVWISGAKLARLAKVIARTTGLSKVIAGAILIGVATSLPKSVTTMTASMGIAPLAANKLFGGVAMQLTVLAVIDWIRVRGNPLTFFAPNPVLLLAGVLLVPQVVLAFVAIATGDVTVVAHLGFWPALLEVFYGMSLYYLNRFDSLETWTAARTPAERREEYANSVKDASAWEGESQELKDDGGSIAWLSKQFAYF